MTLTVANLVDSYGSNYQVLTAVAFISIALPLVVFFSLQCYFVCGVLARGQSAAGVTILTVSHDNE